ncbi:unnamed protein product [Durusdinium trenchii]|uniref:Uncharacterized protein n=1 Tax=Durusdinium trenchii TaxID=1381693 RepID=A0ABP0PFQ5_9DINO
MPGPSEAALDLAWSYAKGASRLRCFEAPCTDIIQRANSIIAYDERVDDHHLEQRPAKEVLVSRAFLRHGLRFDVPVSKGKVGQYKEYPFIAVASWIQTLDKAGKLDRFLGMGPEVRRLADAGPSLLEFWKRYKRLYPNHEVFKLVAENALKLEECVPCYMHGDEGTTYKKGWEDYRDDHSVMSDLLEVLLLWMHPNRRGVRGKLQLMAGSGVPGEVSKTRVEKAYPFDPVKARADL